MSGPVALTRSGRVEGRSEPGVQVFRGVPYARAPSGELRFRAPESAASWQGTRPARRFGKSAPQSVPLPLAALYLIAVGAPSQDEDCLSLNVWTPAVDAGRRPVLVWIHGGAFVMGSGATSLYSGARLARRGDVVVVTLNYRLGALGYLDLCALSGRVDAQSNLGLRDQIAALRWVRDNIESFGGDPENVTVFGESAGAMSVGTLLGTPDAQGLFHRAIAQSGAADHVSAPSTSADVAEQFLRALALPRPDLDALRILPVARILRAQRAVTLPALRSGDLPWQPSVDGDVLPDLPLRAIQAGLSQRIPLLVGTNRDEFKLFSLGDRSLSRMDEQALQRRLERALPGKDPDGTPLADLAHEVYGDGAGRSAPSAPGERWVAFQSDRIFHWPALRLANAHARTGGATYTYLFTWVPPLFGKRLGACHGLEIPFVFGTLRDPLLRMYLGISSVARELSDRMQDAWIAFARSGDPGHAALPDWPRYDAERRATMVLGAQCATEPWRFAAIAPFWERCSEVEPAVSAPARASL